MFNSSVWGLRNAVCLCEVVTKHKKRCVYLTLYVCACVYYVTLLYVVILYPCLLYMHCYTHSNISKYVYVCIQLLT